MASLPLLPYQFPYYKYNIPSPVRAVYLLVHRLRNFGHTWGMPGDTKEPDRRSRPGSLILHSCNRSTLT